jgi:hypothetical protein
MDRALRKRLRGDEAGGQKISAQLFLAGALQNVSMAATIFAIATCRGEPLQGRWLGLCCGTSFSQR